MIEGFVVGRAKKKDSSTERKLTRKETEAGLLKIAGEMLPEMGLQKPDEGLQKRVQAIFAGSSQQKAEPPFLPLVTYYVSEVFKVELKRRKIGRLTAKQLDFILADVKSNTKDLPSLMRKLMDAVGKNLPRRGGPGRRAVLSSAERIDACEQIATMFKTRRMSLPDIFEAVADAFRTKGIKVSARTIKRTWESRTKLYT